MRNAVYTESTLKETRGGSSSPYPINIKRANKMTEIENVIAYKDCIKAETTLELIIEVIQRFKISGECTHYSTIADRDELTQAQDLLVEFAQKYRGRVIMEEIR